MEDSPLHDKRLLALAAERKRAKQSGDWVTGIRVAEECVTLRGAFADYCWLSYFLYQAKELQRSLIAIKEAVVRDRSSFVALSFLKEVDTAYYAQVQANQAAAKRQREREAEQFELARRKREAERIKLNLARQEREVRVASLRAEPRTPDPYEGLHEIAEEAAGLKLHSVSEISSGRSRHSRSYEDYAERINTYSGYLDLEDHDVSSEIYDPPIDEEWD